MLLFTIFKKTIKNLLWKYFNNTTKEKIKGYEILFPIKKPMAVNRSNALEQ